MSKFPVGTKVKSRNGLIGRVICNDVADVTLSLVVLYTYPDLKERIISLYPNGVFYLGYDGGLDIVEVIEEPKPQAPQRLPFDKNKPMQTVHGWKAKLVEEELNFAFTYDKTDLIVTLTKPDGKKITYFYRADGTLRICMEQKTICIVDTSFFPLRKRLLNLLSEMIILLLLK